MNVRALFAQAPYGPKVRALGRTQVLTSPAMADIRQQLAMLVGKEVKDIANIRKTSEVPPRVSVIDVTMAITGKNKNDAAQDFRRVIGNYPAVKANCLNWKFDGARQWDVKLLIAVRSRGVNNPFFILRLSQIAISSILALKANLLYLKFTQIE